ncbi:hypothetical protein N7535_005343 [Penicillium sp. DV-2018c]|nr:hypothetical protein N7461_008924 [Penicillium sp. DV-2018c]KAJ5571683.1 hypothetical protein N7535_005343 [Penicillium sp. DV-2018c]
MSRYCVPALKTIEEGPLLVRPAQVEELKVLSQMISRIYGSVAPHGSSRDEIVSENVDLSSNVVSVVKDCHNKTLVRFMQTWREQWEQVRQDATPVNSAVHVCVPNVEGDVNGEDIPRQKQQVVRGDHLSRRLPLDLAMRNESSIAKRV